MTPRTRSLLLLHGVVVIFGFTGILGKLITVAAEPLVFWRVAIGGGSTACYLTLRKRWQPWGRRDLWKAAAIGSIVAAHWVTFFASIKVSSVGLALTMLATAPLFVGLLEPLVFKRRLVWRELWMAGIVFAGIAVVFQSQQDQVLGMLLGLASAFLAAIFSTLNGVLVRRLDPVNLSAVELLSAAVMMLAWLGVRGQVGPELWTMSGSDWMWILLLAVVATSFAFMVSIQVLKDLSPFESAMAINLEPVYAIVLAWWFFGERLGGSFYLGAGLVIGAVFMDTVWRSRPAKKAKPTPGHQ
ncbi:MAG: DMT family transporter [Flavobacteriales bacterium]|nr:DMT family transporter [Flavobacteriales bacterium]